MQIRCNDAPIGCRPRKRRCVAEDFEGKQLLLDGCALHPKEAERIGDLTCQLAECFTDHRDPCSIEHSLSALVA